MSRKTPESPVSYSTRQISAVQISADHLSAATAESIPSRPTNAYLPPAALVDVLIEQIKYLISHADGGCPGCADCIRLQEAKHHLLLPFLSPPSATVTLANELPR